MGLLPSAPDVQVFAPPIWFVGQQAVIEIAVVTKAETKIDFIDVRATGKQGWVTGAGDTRTGQLTDFPDLVARVADAGVLPVGPSRYRATFTLPPGTAPTHELTPAFAKLELFVHVSIPWWLDGRYRFVVPLRVPPPPRVDRTPVVARSTLAADKPRLEMSLASSRVIAGEAVVGSVALFHIDDRKPREVDIAIASVLTLHLGRRAVQRRGTTYALRLPIAPSSAGMNIPFKFVLPESITPSFRTVTHEVAWVLEASYGSFFGGKETVTVPLEIVDASAAATAARLQVAPRLADARVTAVFDRFATLHRWTVGQDDQDPCLERSHAGATLRITYAYRGKDGTFLVGRVAHRSLGLDLAVTPTSSLRHVFFRDIEIDLDQWDRDHLVRARSQQQAVPFLRQAAPTTIAAIKSIGPLVRWDDDGVSFDRPVVGVDEGELLRIGAALAGLAEVVEAARASITTPPGLTVDPAAWTALASRWRGHFTPGDLSIEGTLDGAIVDVALQWDETGNPSSVRASVSADASEEARRVSLAMPRPASDALAASTPESLVARLTAWPEDFRDLHIHDGVVAASLALSTPAVDAARVRDLVEALRATLAAIEPATSPYR